MIAKKDGTVVDVQVGDDPDDPVFCVTDLLVHLAGKQMAKKANEVVEGEDLDILMGNRPLTCGGGSLDGTQSRGRPGAHARKAEPRNRPWSSYPPPPPNPGSLSPKAPPPVHRWCGHRCN